MLPSHLGPATPIGVHAGVSVFRVARGFVKHFDDARRCQREASLLRAPPDCVVPSLLESGSDWLLLANARVDKRMERWSDERLIEAGALLGRIHGHRLPGAPDARDHARRVRERVKVHGLEQVFQGLIVVGDALCHHDVHASNWLLADGHIVGLMDWSSCGHADPEEDLAALIWRHASPPEGPVLDAWESSSGRPVDRRRVRAYAALLACEEPKRTSPGLEGPPFHGQRRTERCVDKVEHERDRWRPLNATAVDADLAASGLPNVQVTATFTGHACNDVLRVSGHDVPLILKVYNKPVDPWLFELERLLSDALGDSAAQVPSPIRLASGGHLLRVGDRVAAVYADVGDTRPELDRATVARMAAAQAAYLAIPPPEGIRDAAPKDLCVARWTGGRLSADDVDELTTIWSEARALASGLPRSILHLSFHRDHCAVAGDRIAIFDFEKARCGPRVLDVVHTAYCLGYRNNDERLDPPRMVLYLREVHRHLQLTPAERSALPQLLLAAFVSDLAAFQERPDEVERHLGVLREFQRNLHNIEAAVGRYLGP
ncbi:MAG: phosphotransferase [Proteobacteria bacterium]|nr:phosphotransferase [Pseudomonadota bacterium]